MTKLVRRVALLAALAVAALGPSASAQLGLTNPKFTGLLIASTTGSTSVTGTTNETNLASLRIPAGVLGKNGAVEIKALFSFTNSANTKTIIHRYTLSANAVTGGAIGASATATTTATAQTLLIIRANNSFTSQQVFGASQFTPFGTAGTAIGSVAYDLSANDTYVNINGQLAVGTETLTLIHAYAVVYPAP